MNNTKLVFRALMLAILCVSAFIKIPIPYIPFTLQFLVVIILGQVFGAKSGGLIVLLYILLGLIGIPVFTSGGGIGYIFQPTFGYLLGFFFACVIIGIFVKYIHIKFYRVIANVLGMCAMYVCGSTYMYFLSKLYLHQEISIEYILVYGILVQIPGDLLLSFIGAYLSKRIIKLIGRYRRNGETSL